jgi:hypothetical protein
MRTEARIAAAAARGLILRLVCRVLLALPVRRVPFGFARPDALRVLAPEPLALVEAREPVVVRPREDARDDDPPRAEVVLAFAEALFCVRAAAMSAQSVVRLGQRPYSGADGPSQAMIAPHRGRENP